MAKYYKLTKATETFINYATEDVEPKNGHDFSLSELQGYVGGYVEIADLRDGRLMVVNENGLSEGLPLNPLATAIFQEQTGSDEYIVGNVLICDAEQIL